MLTKSKLGRKWLGLKTEVFTLLSLSAALHPGARFLVSFRPNVPATALVFGVTVLVVGFEGVCERLYH